MTETNIYNVGEADQLRVENETLRRQNQMLLAENDRLLAELEKQQKERQEEINVSWAVNMAFAFFGFGGTAFAVITLVQKALGG